MTAARTTLLAALAAAGIEPCADSSCMFGPPGGMSTNHGCRCLERAGLDGLSPEARVFFRRLAHACQALAEGAVARPAPTDRQEPASTIGPDHGPDRRCIVTTPHARHLAEMRDAAPASASSIAIPHGLAAEVLRALQAGPLTTAQIVSAIDLARGEEPGVKITSVWWAVFELRDHGMVDRVSLFPVTWELRR